MYPQAPLHGVVRVAGGAAWHWWLHSGQCNHARQSLSSLFVHVGNLQGKVVPQYGGRIWIRGLHEQHLQDKRWLRRSVARVSK